MILAEHTIHTNLSIEKIWAKLSDVSSWSEWDKNLEFSDLDGPLDIEATGVMKPCRGKSTIFIITELEPYKRLVDKSKVGFADLVTSYYLDKKNNQTVLTNKIEIEGPLAFLFVLAYGKKLKEDLPKCLESFLSAIS